MLAATGLAFVGASTVPATAVTGTRVSTGSFSATGSGAGGTAGLAGLADGTPGVDRTLVGDWTVLPSTWPEAPSISFVTGVPPTTATTTAAAKPFVPAYTG